MNLSISKINHTINAYTPVSGFNTPNWEQIPHKGMKTLPEDELIRRVKENGVKFAHATNSEEIDSLGNELNNLTVQYMSSVSPDRKILYRDAMQVISQHQASSKQKPLQRIRTIYDFLNERDGIKIKQSDLTQVAEPLPSGGSVSASNLMGGGFSYSVQAGGINVLSTSDQNWCYSRTPQEREKADDVYKIYKSAVEGERCKMKLNTSSQNTHPNSFEAKA